MRISIGSAWNTLFNKVDAMLAETPVALAVPAEKENTVEEAKNVVDGAFPLAMAIAKMTVAQLDGELRRLDVRGRSRATTKAAKQALLSSFIVTAEREAPELSVGCHRCGNAFEPDEQDYRKFLASGNPFDPTDWVCLDCRAEESLIWELQQAGIEAEPMVVETAATVDAEEPVPLERLASEWWTPAAVAARLGTVADPAREDEKAYCFAPSLTRFVFKLGEKLFDQGSFHPATWIGKGWQVRIAMVDERTGHPDLKQFRA